MNENNNRVTAPFSAAGMASAMTALDNLDSIAAPLESLTPEERMALPKISVDNRVFVEDAIDLMGTPAGGAILPTFLVPANAASDIESYNQMEQLIARLDTLRARFNDHRILAGSEAYSTALTFKKLAEAAFAAGLPGTEAIVTQLRERFAGQGGSSGGSGGGATQ